MTQLIQYEQGKLVSSKCKFNESGLEIDQNISYGDWCELGELLQSTTKSVQWWVGDWIAFGEQKYGEIYSQALEETKYTYDTLRQIKFVCEHVQMLSRRNNLSFAHHQEVAGLEANEQEEMLVLAEDNGWSAKRLRSEIKLFQKEKRRNESAEQGKNAGVPAKFYNDDFRNIHFEPESIDLILTDPPYPQEYLPLWSDLAKLAANVLKPSGFLVCYSGQLHLPEVYQRLSEHLDYYWTFCLYHTGSTQIIHPRGVMCRWKPVLVFQKPPFKKIPEVFQDYVGDDKMEKDGHDWQQGEDGASKLIEAFSSPGDTALDPFMGSGTFPHIAHQLKRKAIGVEIDEQSFNISKSRFHA